MNTFTIEPFWKRLPKIFAYGLNINNVGMAAMYSLLQFVAALLPFSFIWQILLWMGLYKYVYEVLITTARGQLEPPEISVRNINDYMALKQLGLLILMGALSFMGFSMVHPVVGIIVGGFFLLALPASIMALSMTASVFSALNPLLMVSVMARIGSPYFLLFVFELLLALSSYTLRTFVEPLMPSYIGMPVIQMIDYVFLIIMFHLIGYAMHQYHQELGLEQDDVHTRATESEVPTDPILFRVHNLIQEGQVDDARKLLKDVLQQQGGTPDLHEQYRKLIRLSNDNEELLNHGKSYINVLLALEDSKRALQVTAECLSLDKNFRLADPKQVHQLAEVAMATGQAQLALSLTNGFGKKYPKHRDILPNYLLAARILSERMNQDDKAIAILKQLVRKFPNHPKHAEAQQLLQVLENLAGG
ncbi:MAG: tetratricopeptide repeat protein [bacterium]